MPVEVGPGAVVSHRGPWVGMTGRDLGVAKVDAGVEHRGDEGVSEHVGVHACDPDASLALQVLEPSGGGVAVHAAAGPGSQ